MKLKLFMISSVFLSCSCFAKNVNDFEAMLAGFGICEFEGVFLPSSTVVMAKHEYFIKRNLKPYKIANSLAYYHVSEVFYGLPVSELIIPVTFDVHSITIDLPMERVVPVIDKYFPNVYRTDLKLDDGAIPVLHPNLLDPEKTSFYCSSLPE